MFFWILFYIITAIIILTFFINESKITSKINFLADKILENFKLENINKNIIYGINILTLIFIVGIYNFFMDKTKSEIIPIKFYALHFTILANVLSLILNRYKDYLFILNFLMVLAGFSIFGIDDAYFKYTMLISLIPIFISLILDKDRNQGLKRILNGFFLIFLISVLQLHYLGNYVIPTKSMEPTILVQDRIFSNNIIYKFYSPKLNDIISFKEPLEKKYMYTKRITGISGTLFEVKDNRVYSDNLKISERYYSFGEDSIYSLIKGPIYIPKKGDIVMIYKVIEFDFKNNTVKFIEPSELLKENIDYKELVGVYNLTNNASTKRYSFLMKAHGHDELMLPILDFKYNKKDFEALLRGEQIVLTDDYYMAMGDNTDNSQDSRYFGYVKRSDIKGKLFLRWFPLNRVGKVKDEF